MAVLHKLISCFDFWLKSHSLKGHGVHSPFVYKLITETLTGKTHNSDKLVIVEKLRKELSKDNRKIKMQDLGAGRTQKELQVKQILKKAASSPRKCRLLYYIVQEIKPTTIIELGTSLGIGTISLSLASPGSTIYTIEGSVDIAAIAQENFNSLNLNNIHSEIGPFEEILPHVILKAHNPFFVYIDGNHRYKPTVEYFNQVIDKIENNSCIVIDDIRWTGEMEEAWIAICSHAKSVICIDLFDVGIVYYKENTQKVKYNIRYW